MVLTNGETSITLDEGDFKLERVSYDSPSFNNAISPLSGDDGELFVSRGVGARGIKLEGYIGGAIEENRRALFRLCSSKSLTLVDGEYSLEIALTKMPSLSNERRFKDKLLKYELSAIAPSPYWQGAKISQTFYGCSGTSTDDNAIKISNIGDLPTGAEIRVYLMTGANSLTLQMDGSFFKYNASLSTLDALYIDTRNGKKSVKLLKNGSTERVSVIENVMPGSAFFQLKPGENRIDFMVPLGVAYISITYNPLYLR